MTKLTRQQIRQARQWRSQGRRWPWMAEQLGCDPETVRRVLDSDYAQRRAEQIRQARRERNKREPALTSSHDGYHLRASEFTPAYDPSRDGMPVYDSPGAELLGDPPRGRSALDRRGAQR